MQLFSQGKDTGWGHTGYKVEYDIIRSGSKLGIRWRITWNIDKYYYFGYNIVAQVWTEGSNYGRQIKANTPNKGSGVSYFPNERDYLWFDKGYANNNITGCRIIISSTNGGTIPYNTGADRTLVAPTGYTASTIASDVNFNIGENLPMIISDITNQPYNYKLYLEIYKEDNTWEQVKYLETTAKNFILTLTDIATTLYNLLPNSNSRPCRIKLETYISTTLIGTYIKDATCSVVNSNPEIPNFVIIDNWGLVTTAIDAGFGPYNDKSNVVLATEDSTILAKNGATLEKIIIEWNGDIEEVALGVIIGGYELPVGYSAISEKTYANNEEFRNSLKNNQDLVKVSVVDSRGNVSSIVKPYDIFIYERPKLVEYEAIRVNDIETGVRLKATGKKYQLDNINYIQYTVSTKKWVNEDTTGLTYGPFNIDLSEVTYNDNYTEFYLNSLIQGNLGASGFTFGQKFYIKIEIADAWNDLYPDVYYTDVKNGKILMSYADGGVAFGADYDETIGGPLQINGKSVSEELASVLTYRGSILVADDFNNYITPGIYVFGGANAANRPLSFGVVEVIVTPYYILQRCTNATHMSLRVSYDSGSTWEAWKTITFT